MQESLKVVQCCMGGNAANADFLRPIIASLGMEFVTISEWPEHDILWDKDNWLQQLSQADIVVCVQRYQLQPAKSNNRATQGMSLGKPVIASPLRAYREAILHGETGFICETPGEWESTLRALRDDPGLRARIGSQAKVAAQEKYSIDAVGGQWLSLLESLTRESGNPPKVDIIIPTWNNLRYLQECLKSIRLNTDWPFNIIVVDSGTDGTKEWLQSQPDVIYYHHPSRLHFSAANNIGLRISKEDYVCFLNDDTVVAVNWLPALMREAMKPGIGGVNPFSNCDQGWLHNEPIVVGGVDLHPSMTLEQVAAVIPQIYQFRHLKVVAPREWLPFYCTLVPKKVIGQVGLLDEEFKSGCEDLDYCKRIASLGYRFVTTFDSFVFHFGGTTRKNSEKVGYQQHHQEDRNNHAIIARKYGPPLPVLETVGPGIPWGQPSKLSNGSQLVPWGSRPKRVTFFTGQGWEKWSPRSIDEGGIGGSETCVIYAAREFAKRGYEVTVYGDPGDYTGSHQGVQYLPWQNLDLSQDHDIFISSRRPDIFDLPIQARKKICYVHDIWVHQDPNANINVDKIDKFFVLSPWHREFFSKHHKISIDKLYLTRNGVDLERFKNPLPKIRGRMIYSSSPDRGLDVLLDCLPRIRKILPEAHLKIFYGFDNWKLACEQRKDPHEIQWMNRILQQINQPGVEYVGRVGQKQLAEEFLQSELWGYSTAFSETFGISAVEAMASGTPVVATNYAGLTSTVGDAGVLIGNYNGDLFSRPENGSEAYQNYFVEVCCRVLTDWPLWQDLSARGREKAKEYQWPNIIDEWIKELE